jgi:Kef-type K+ transport system membrane component KefB
MMHPVTITELFLIAMLLVFALPWLVWRIGRTDYWMPLVVVQIVAGILLGPGIAGALFPEAHAALFRPEVIQSLNGIAWWAVMLFVFLAGIELDIAEAWAQRSETAVTATLALLVPLAAGAGAGALMLGWSDAWIGPEGASWQVIAGIGMACAVTALPILVLLMEKLAILREPLGQRILRYASLDDIAIWAVLALVLLDWERIGRQGAFLLMFASFAWGIRLLMARIGESDRWPVALVWMAAAGLAADWAGLHYMVGAFLAGAVLDPHWFAESARDRFRNVLLLAFMPVFFLSTGLRTEWTMGGAAVIGASALLLAAAVGGKLIGIRIAGRILGWQKGEAAIIGWLLQTKALIMIIFAQVLLDRGIISGATFTALLLMAVASTMLTVPMVTPRLAKLRALIAKRG